MRLLVAAVLLVACKGKQDQPAPVPVVPTDATVVDAPPPDEWIAACKTALTEAAKQPTVRRTRTVIDGCKPCGSWRPLLEWNKLPDAGGPALEAIETAMKSCNAFCDNNSRDRFFGALDEARGKNSHTPWRKLGELCKEKVSAVPDARFVSAPYFALDRIGRALDKDLAPLAAQLDLALPPVGVTGDGFELTFAPLTQPEYGPFQITITAAAINIGHMPTARLSAAGVTVDHHGEPWPGVATKLKDLPAALDKLVGIDASPILVIAPSGLPAKTVVAAIDKHKFVLGAALRSTPQGWTLPGQVPVAMSRGKRGATAKTFTITDAKSVDAANLVIKTAPLAELADAEIVITGAITVHDLANLLGALAYREVPHVVIR